MLDPIHDYFDFLFWVVMIILHAVNLVNFFILKKQKNCIAYQYKFRSLVISTFGIANLGECSNLGNFIIYNRI